MKDFLFAASGFIVFVIFLGFALWMGAVLITIVVISSILLLITLKFKIFYYRWRNKGIFNPTDPMNAVYTQTTTTTRTTKSGDNTIIDVEYQEISDK